MSSGALTREAVARETEQLKALSEQSGYPGMDLNRVCVLLSALDLVPRTMVEQHQVLPVLVKDDRMFVAMANPADQKLISHLEFASGRKVFAYIALPVTLERTIAQAYVLKGQSRRHFVGPDCPPETRRKAGASVVPPPLVSEKAFEKAAPIDPSVPANRPLDEASLMPGAEGKLDRVPVVVDGKAETAEAAPDIDFGDLVIELPEESEAEGEDKGGLSGSVPEGPMVLVVDDASDVRLLIKRILTERGYRVVEAGDGEQALSCLKSERPDAIVLDAMLPKVHGFEIARQLTESERYRDIPIVMVSAIYRGWRFAEDIKANYGVVAYIEKPFKIADIVNGVADALQQPANRMDTTSISERAAGHLERGLQAVREGKLELGIEELRAGVQVEPLAFNIHFQLGLMYAKSERTYEAIQSLETALSIRSDYFPALKNLGALYQNAGFRNKAMEMWERCLTVAPDEATRETIKQHLVAVL